jgi:hypothetical protein
MRCGRTPTWGGWSPSVRWRTSVIMSAKAVAAAHIQSAPRSDALRPAPERAVDFVRLRSVAIANA